MFPTNGHGLGPGGTGRALQLRYLMKRDTTTVAAANPPTTVRSEAMLGMEVDKGWAGSKENLMSSFESDPSYGARPSRGSDLRLHAI